MGIELVGPDRLSRIRIASIGNDPSWDVSSIEPNLSDQDASVSALRTVTGLRRDFEMSK